MAAPETELRGVIKSALSEAFPELTVLDDKLHPSLGYEGALAGVSPIESKPGKNQFVLEFTALVQVFHRWEKEVDNEQTVDPAPIEEAAQAFREQLRERQTQGTGAFWYLQLDSIRFPDDPTGNKTRFEAVVRGRGDNVAALNETTL